MQKKRLCRWVFGVMVFGLIVAACSSYIPPVTETLVDGWTTVSNEHIDDEPRVVSEMKPEDVAWVWVGAVRVDMLRKAWICSGTPVYTQGIPGSDARLEMDNDGLHAFIPEGKRFVLTEEEMGCPSNESVVPIVSMDSL